MGPIRGLKRKNKDENKVDQNALDISSSLGSQLNPLDWWDEFSQRITGPLATNSTKFESVLKISRKTFNYICSLVKEDMMAKTSHCVDTSGKPLSHFDQVAVAIRRLGSGESLSSVGDSLGISPSTVSQLTWRFVESMEDCALPRHLSWPATEAELGSLRTRFEKIRGLPDCLGAIDTTHILMTLPGSEDNGVWLDGEENSSMVLQAVVDPDMRFRSAIAGWPGSLSDEDVLRSSGLFRLSEAGERLGSGYIVGDSCFPLLPWLMTPYNNGGNNKGRGLADYQSEFNKRHSATRMVAQRALARLKETWKIIHGVMWKPDRHRLPRIVVVCCVLHNIVIDMEDEMQDEVPLTRHHDPGYRQRSCAFADEAALVIRERLSMRLAGRSVADLNAAASVTGNGYL